MADQPALPFLYAGWIEALIGCPLPAEPRTTCRQCVMLPSADAAASPNRVFFDPATKCCTFMPSLPNFVAGAILADADAALEPGRATLTRRVRAGIGVTPFGIARTPAYALLYRTAPEAFGRSPSMRCPHYTEAGGGSCSIWPHRGAVCATYFCRFDRGTFGKRFWIQVCLLLQAVEEELARWCALELAAPAAMASTVAAWPWPWSGRQARPEMLSAADLEGRVPPEHHAATWGEWHGREAEFYQACAARVASLDWERVTAICGPEVHRLSRLVQEAHRLLLSDVIPPRLRAGQLQTVDLAPGGAVVVTYSPLDPLRVSFTLLRLLGHFDGRPTAVVLRELDEKEHVRLKPSLLRRLVDHGVLIEA